MGFARDSTALPLRSGPENQGSRVLAEATMVICEHNLFDAFSQRGTFQPRKSTEQLYLLSTAGQKDEKSARAFLWLMRC
jgi:hypothetical protein